MAYTPKHILIISASIGGGHKAAATALEQACQAKDIRVSHIDLLDYTSTAFQKLYRDAFIQMLEAAPDAVNFFGKLLDRNPKEKNTKQSRMMARLNRLVSRRLPKAIHKLKPDLIIHTHFLAPAILGVTSHIDVAEAVVVTDYGAHQLWLQPNVDRYFVATEEMRVHLESAGVDGERICVSGIPIDEKFNQLEARGEARASLNITQDQKTLLLMASGLDEETLETLLKQLITLEIDLQVFIICGRSEHLVESANKILQNYQGPLKFEVLGFVTEIPSYMAASDMIAGKSGGLTTTEALAAGLAFALVTPYPPQEVANGNYLLEKGIALNIDPLTIFGYKVSSAFEDADKLVTMQQNALEIAKPNAAVAILDALLDDPLPRPKYRRRYSWLPWNWPENWWQNAAKRKQLNQSS